MHPEFRRYLEGRKGKESLRVRVSSDEKAKLSDMVRVEGGSTVELLVEGIWRVVMSRSTSSSHTPLRPRVIKDGSLSIRLSGAEVVALEAIATEEKRSLSDLVGEGIWHMVANRQQNIAYQAKARQILSLLSKVEAIRSTLHEPTQ